MRTIGRAILLLAALALALLAGAGTARAQARHERVSVKPIKDQGKIVGAMIKLTLRPAPGFTTTRVGLGAMSRAAYGNDHRAAASDPKAGYLLHQFPELTGLAQPRELELELRYGQHGGGLRGGETVDVVTAWNNPSNRSYWHVWGMQTIMNDPTSVVKLPTDVPDALVTFKVRATTKPGESIHVAGSAGEIGRWDPGRALAMTPSDCKGQDCTWTVQVKLTQGTPVDLKFLRKAGARMLGWENGGNHSLAVGAAAQADFDGGAFR